MSGETKLYNFRLPIVLIERAKAIPSLADLTMTDIVRAGIEAGIAGSAMADGVVAAKDAEIAILKKTVSELARQLKMTLRGSQPPPGIGAAQAAGMQHGQQQRVGLGAESTDSRPVASLSLPVLTEFPKRGTALRGQKVDKGKP
jgi:predicted DNA-binding protein